MEIQIKFYDSNDTWECRRSPGGEADVFRRQRRTSVVPKHHRNFYCDEVVRTIQLLCVRMVLRIYLMTYIFCIKGCFNLYCLYYFVFILITFIIFYALLVF